MKSIVISSFLSMIVMLFVLHFGCFFFPHHPPPTNHNSPSKRRKISPLSPSPSPSLSTHHHKRRNSIKSYLKQLFSFSKPANNDPQPQQIVMAHEDIMPTPSPPILIPLSPASSVGKSQSFSKVKQNVSDVCTFDTKAASFASRADIHPCPTCSEVLPNTHLLDLHQATKHAFMELRDGESGKTIVGIIFQSGWKGRTSPTILRILKVQNSPKTLARFEEYRESVKSRAARFSDTRRGGAEHERCIADGNERLRFYCTTVLCGLGGGGRVHQVGVCGGQYCTACAIVRQGFGGKQADVDGIATHGTSWGAHVALPEELEEEFGFLHVRRAMLVCRVVAGRAACGGEKGLLYDSAVVPAGCGGSHVGSLGGEEELLVYNPRALLPCFVIIYTATSSS